MPLSRNFILITLGAVIATAGLIVWIGHIASGFFAIGAVGAVLLFVALVKYPTLGLPLVAAVIPIERFGRLTDDMETVTISLMRIVGVLVLGALLLNLCIRRRRFEWCTPLTLYIGYAAFAFMSVLFTTSPSHTIRNCLAISGNIMFFFLIHNLIRSRRSADLAVATWLAVSVAIGLLTAYNWHFGASDYKETAIGKMENRFMTAWQDEAEYQSLGGLRRALGPTSHAPVYGINLVMTIPFLAYFLHRRQSLIMQGLLWFGAAVIGYNLLLNNTRATFLVAGFSIVLCVWRGLVRLRPQAVALLLALGATGIVLAPADVQNRILNITNYSTDQAATWRIRMDYWHAAVEILKDHWLLGIGMANGPMVGQYLTVEGAPEETTVHNVVLQTWLDVGLIGMILFFSFIALTWVYASRCAAVARARGPDEHSRWLMVSCQILIVTVVVDSLQVDAFQFPLKGFWLAVAVVTAMHQLTVLAPKTAPIDDSNTVTLPSAPPTTT